MFMKRDTVSATHNPCPQPGVMLIRETNSLHGPFMVHIQVQLGYVTTYIIGRMLFPYLGFSSSLMVSMKCVLS